MRLKLIRKYPKSNYIIGELYADGEYLCSTLELPWKDNKARISCIPTGIYSVEVTYSSKFKRNLPLLLNVPGRSGIRIHRGNYPKDSTGCILTGENTVKGAVMNSKPYELKLVNMIQVAKSKREITTIQIIDK